MPVNGYCKYVIPGIENILLSVAMMVIDIKNYDIPETAQVIGGNGVGVKVAKSAEGLFLCMMTGRTYKSICKSLTR